MISRPHPQLLTICQDDADWIILGNYNSDRFGWSVAQVGDLNSDGADDILIGAIQARNIGGPFDYVSHAEGYADVYTYNSLTSEGSVLLHFQEFAFNVSTPAIVKHCVYQFGFSVAAAGDVNADNIPDVIIGAPGVREMPTATDPCFPVVSDPTDHPSYSFNEKIGAVWVYSGVNGAVLEGPIMPSELPAGAWFGYAVAGGIDWDESQGDDNDITVSAVLMSNDVPATSPCPCDVNGYDVYCDSAGDPIKPGGRASGRAYVLTDLLGAGGPTIAGRLKGVAGKDRMGFGLAIGDFGGNGRKDVIVGSNAFDIPLGPGQGHGQVYVFQNANL